MRTVSTTRRIPSGAIQGLATIALLATLSCTPQQSANFQAQLNQLATGAVLEPPVPGQQGPGVQETILKNIFRDHPYDTQAKFDGQYPRVALDVLSSPPRHNDDVAMPGGSFDSYHHLVPECWTLRAKLWTSATASQDVGPFQWCAPRDIVPDQSLIYGPFAQWFTSVRLFALTEPTTGNRRTDGPIPPDSPVPSDPQSQAYYGQAMMDLSHGDAIMFNCLLKLMAFDTTIHKDRRVWIVRFDAAG